MPANTEFPAPGGDSRPQRRRQAILSSLVSAAWMVLYALVILWVRQRYFPGGAVGLFLAAAAAVDFLLLIPLVFSLKERLKEIQGGEEDEARQY